MTNRKTTGRRKLAYQVLGMIGISALFAVIVFLVISYAASVMAETYCFDRDIPMTEFDWIEVDRWIFGGSTAISVGCFSVLFLALLSDRMAYIRKLTYGIDCLRMGQSDRVMPLEGNNELTELAAAINQMSAAQRQLQEKEQQLAREKDQFIRTLSHDIRTPLTSVLAYSEYLATEEDLPEEVRLTHLQMIHRKAQQIRDLTDLLLEGGKRNPERFPNARLLMEQLAQELEAELEDQFRVSLDFSACPAFAGTFDVQELRRIFDNLASNIAKYADPAQPVSLTVSMTENMLTIRQTNVVLPTALQTDSYGLGIRSIQRIAQHYGGRATVEQNTDTFSITVALSDF